MAKSLPRKPSFRHLRNEARSILNSHKAGDSSCTAVIRNLRQLKDASDNEILETSVSLQEIQFALALEYGFASWSDIKKHIDKMEGVLSPSERIDVTGMNLRASMMKQDVFSLLNQRIAQLYGNNLDYEAIHCLSTNAYSLGIYTGEDCTSWWHHAGRSACWDIITGMLGLSVGDLKIDGLEVTPEQSEEEFDAASAEQRKQYSVLMRDAMDKGGVVVVDGGWSSRGPHAFIPWVMWGIITQAEDGTIQGAAFNGHDDNPIEYISDCWSLSPASRSLTQEEADRAMLRHAAERLRGTGERYTYERTLFGLPAMDKWIEQMETVQGFCPGCFERAPDRAWTDANDNGQTFYGGTQSVSKYLRQRRSFHPSISSRLGTVATHYEQMGEILRLSAANNGEQYKTFIGDLAKQKEHADRVLRPIKDEMARATDEIEAVSRELS